MSLCLLSLLYALFCLLLSSYSPSVPSLVSSNFLLLILHILVSLLSCSVSSSSCLLPIVPAPSHETRVTRHETRVTRGAASQEEDAYYIMKDLGADYVLVRPAAYSCNAQLHTGGLQLHETGSLQLQGTAAHLACTVLRVRARKWKSERANVDYPQH